jgi:hypothetical protein
LIESKKTQKFVKITEKIAGKRQFKAEFSHKKIILYRHLLLILVLSGRFCLSVFLTARIF